MTGTLVVRADAVRLLPALPDGCVDAVVTDPPWNLGRPYGASEDRMAEEEYVRWLRAVLRECARVSRGPVAACLGTRNARRAAGVGGPGRPARDGPPGPGTDTGAAPPLGSPRAQPVPVMAALVRLACPPRGLVLDPFAGTGSTLVAARWAGRRSLGLELEQRFCRTAARRLSARRS